MHPSVTEFIEARIAEDEAAATPTWPTDVDNWPLWDYSLRVVPDNPSDEQTDHHLAIHTRRVAAQCEAIRQIVELHGPHAGWCNWTQDNNDTHGDFPDDPCDNLRALAAIWYDHPDYDEEWRI